MLVYALVVYIVIRISHKIPNYFWEILDLFLYHRVDPLYHHVCGLICQLCIHCKLVLSPGHTLRYAKVGLVSLGHFLGIF